MNHGTVIEELFKIVEQVEVHAQPAEVHAVEMQTMAMKMENPEAIYPAFLSELLQANFGMAGVA